MRTLVLLLAVPCAQAGALVDPDPLCSALKSSVNCVVLCGAEVSKYNYGSFNGRCHDMVPAYVVKPSHTSDVQASVRLARGFNRSFSVRGGGHNYVCNGFKLGSVHLDMRGMKDFDIYEESSRTFARMGPGHTNGDLERHIPAGYEYAVGTCPGVGVVGYHVHGGSSPRTKYLANTSVVAMDVVTANGTMLTLSSNSSNVDLWKAMRMAGSSFGVVTSLTILLRPKPQRAFLLIPTLNGFEDLFRALKQPVDDDDNWVGLFRWDRLLFPLKWCLKTSLPSHTDLNIGTDVHLNSSVGRAASALHIHYRKHNVDVGLVSLIRLLDWMDNQKLRIDLPSALRVAPNRFEFGVDQPKYPAVTDAGSNGGFHSTSVLKKGAYLNYNFYSNHTNECWYDLGPLKGLNEDVFLDLSCYTTSAVGKLRLFMEANRDEYNQDASRYYNLPLQGTLRQTYWPNYDELADIKNKWDPTDFFNIPDGIHPALLPAQYI